MSVDGALSRIWEQSAAHSTDGSTEDGVAALNTWRAETGTQRWDRLEGAELPPEDQHT